MTTSPRPAVSAIPTRDPPRYYRTDTHEPAPSYHAEEHLWGRWEVVDKAHSRVAERQAAVAELEPALTAKTKEYKKMKETSSRLFASLQSKPRSGPFKRKGQEEDTYDKELTRQAFEAAHSEEVSCLEQLETLRGKVDALKTQIRKDAALAGTIDQAFELLVASVARSANGDSEVTEEEETLARMASLYDLAQKDVADFTRARVTIQHAHLYFSTVCSASDTLRGTALSRVTRGGFGEFNKREEYKVAVETGSKAQTCFDGAMRVLERHVSEIPTDILEDYEALKDMGLLQASKVYDLMFGWQQATSGVNKTIESMLQKQDKAYDHLTHLAVWVQDTVPVYEARLRSSLAARDRARRALVAIWKAQAERPG